MINFIAGVIVGITVATVGFSGVAEVLDRGVEATKEMVDNAVR